MNSAKKERKIIEREKPEICSRKLEILKEPFVQRWTKDKNGRDLIEAEEIKKRWQEYTEELYQKDLEVLENPDSVIADLEPDILESKVKWALERASWRSG